LRLQASKDAGFSLFETLMADLYLDTGSSVRQTERMKTSNFLTRQVAMHLTLSLVVSLWMVGCKSSDASLTTNSAPLSSGLTKHDDDSQDDDNSAPDEISTGESQLAFARCRNTANKLQDNRVLVVGGLNDGSGSSEIYDPLTNTWQMGPDSNAPGRMGGKSVVLNDGRILYVGGEYQDSDQRVRPVREIEVFDPQDGQFHIVARQSLTANGASVTLLQDGRVLLIGGSYFDYDRTRQITLRGSEIFDPQTNTLRPTSFSMRYPRAGHTATLMPGGGEVFVVGGAGEFGAIANTEVFHVGWEAFTETNPLRVARFGHFATLDGLGRLLVIGGTDVVSGYARPLESFESLIGALDLIPNISLSSYAASFLQRTDKSIVISGGREKTNGDFLKSVRIYDPENKVVLSAPDLLYERANHSTTELDDGSLLIVGGENSVGCLQSAERVWLEGAVGLESP
jgi:hypothetical protein